MLLIKQFESEMTLWDVNGITLKKKRPKRIKIQVEYMRNLVRRFMLSKLGEPNPESNQTLRLVLERAKTYSVPNHIIEKAIDKAKGAGRDENFDHLRYEGFGPSGSMLIVDALTNNVNRTASDVRAAFGKNGGNMGVSGSVAYMFDHVATFGIEGKSVDDILETLMEQDVDVNDVIDDNGLTIVYAEPDQFAVVQDALRAAGVEEFKVA